MSNPDELATRVLFASDRTCCICRSEKLKIQIHHIDGDHNNNVFENLAVVCVFCHIDVHSVPAFVRKIPPDLVRTYNVNWREIVKTRMTPSEVDPARFELLSQLYLDITAACFIWKFGFCLWFDKRRSKFRTKSTDEWDQLKTRIPSNTKRNYVQAVPIFKDNLYVVIKLFDDYLRMFGDVLPMDFRLRLLRALHTLVDWRSCYVDDDDPFELDGSEQDSMFQESFEATIDCLGTVYKDARERIATLKAILAASPQT